MRILVVTDIHGDFEKLDELIGIVKKEKFDLIICPGDFTDMFSIPKEFSQMDIADLIIQKLLVLKAPMLCVPGNHDPYDILFLFDEYNINLHAKVKEVGKMKFMGWGGAPTPFNTIFEPSDEETKDSIKSLENKVKPNEFVLVTHDPPKDTAVDKVKSGEHVGSPVIREFIERAKPILAISAHIHESQGTDKIGNTTIFYPGALFNGNYGVVETEGKTVKCEHRKF